MKNLNLSRCTLSVCVAAILLAACGGSHGPVGPPGANAVMPGVARTAPALGGAFSGGYSGTGTGTLCTYKSGGAFFFDGSGNSSFLGQGKESVLVQGRKLCSWSGGATLQSSRHPNQVIFIALSEGRGSIASPCTVTFTYTVHGGTGKFAHAKGSGTLTFQCSGSMYSDQWSGTISF